MKKINKKEELFICEECQFLYKNLGELSKHINRTHFNSQIYYNKWILENDEDKCKICGGKAKYAGGLLGYKNFCSRKCAIEYNTKQRKISNLKKFGCESPFGNKEVQNKSKQTMLKKYQNDHYTNPNKSKQTCLEKYGVDNGSKTKEAKEKIKQACLKNNGVNWPMQSDKIKEKSKRTCLEKYGVEYSLQSTNNKEKSRKTMLKKYGVEYSAQDEKIYDKVIKTKKEKYGGDFSKQFREKAKETMKIKYGNENYNNIEKIKKTCLEKYDKDNYMNTEDFKAKSKQTNLERYGVEYISQNKKIHERIQKSCFRIKRFKNTDIWYRGSYELDFLEKYYDKYSDLKRGLRFKYQFNKSEKYYFSDFYIPSRNLIIEIKSSHLLKKNLDKIEAKKKAVINSNYDFIMIVDKNYSGILL